jgi:hypothetical protein
MKRPPTEFPKVMEEWGAWFKELESKGVPRNPGSALAPGGAVITRNGKGFVTDTTMAEVKDAETAKGPQDQGDLVLGPEAGVAAHEDHAELVVSDEVLAEGLPHPSWSGSTPRRGSA